MTHTPPPTPAAQVSAATPAVEIRDVVCQFGNVRALAGLTLSVKPGTVVGIVGPNGAGKTTLIDVICGLVRPSSGSARVFGQDVSENSAALRAKIGVLQLLTSIIQSFFGEGRWKYGN